MEIQNEKDDITKQRENPFSDLWKRKYTLLLKKTDMIEKQNLRLINRLYEIKKMTRQFKREKRYLMKKLDKHDKNYRKEVFYFGNEFIYDERKVQTSAPMPPKKPLNAFIRYFNDQRPIILETFVGITHPDLTKKISSNWNNLDQETKKKYFELFEEDKERYENELRIYNELTKEIEDHQQVQKDLKSL